MSSLEERIERIEAAVGNNPNRLVSNAVFTIGCLDLLTFQRSTCQATSLLWLHEWMWVKRLESPWFLVRGIKTKKWHLVINVLETSMEKKGIKPFMHIWFMKDMIHVSSRCQQFGCNLKNVIFTIMDIKSFKINIIQHYCLIANHTCRLNNGGDFPCNIRTLQCRAICREYAIWQGKMFKISSNRLQTFIQALHSSNIKLLYLFQ